MEIGGRKLVNKKKLLTILLILIVIMFLFSLYFVEARDQDDPIVSGDDVPVLSDGGENIPKNRTEPVEKDVEQPQPENINIYQPPAEMVTLLDEFKSKYGEPWKVKWDEKHGTVKSINAIDYDTGSKLNTKEDIDKVSRVILKGSKDLFSIDDVNNLEIRDIYHTSINNRVFWTIKYHRTYEGIPIHRGYVGLGFRGTNLTGIGSRYYPVSVPTTTPRISKQKALEIAVDSYVVGQSDVYKNSTELIILPFEVFDEDSTKTYLAWVVHVNILHPVTISDNVYIDAITGNILYKENRLKGTTGGYIITKKENSIIIYFALIVFFAITIVLSISFLIKKREIKYKEFIKPTKEKIVIFIILMIITLFLPLVPVLKIVKCITGNCHPNFSFIRLYDMPSSAIIFSVQTVVAIIIELLVLYSLSCLIIFIYNKIKGNKVVS